MLSKTFVSLACFVTVVAITSEAIAQPAAPCSHAPLIGMGLVIGLHGTGDSFAKYPATREAVRNYLAQVAPDNPPKRVGQSVSYSIHVDPSEYEGRVALVFVTSTINICSDAPKSDKQLFDLAIEAGGDATSLEHGALVLTGLASPGGEVMAVGEGALTDCSTEASNELKRHGMAGIAKCILGGGIPARLNRGQ
jgi:flagellar P-ring protein precursor FlgI